MKRLVVILIFVFSVSLGVLYLGISSTQSFSRSILISCTQQGALRVLVQERSIKQGWPGKKINDSNYQFQTLLYSINTTFIDVINLSISYNNNSANAQLTVKETTPDSSRFTITALQKLPLNPFERIKTYLSFKQLIPTVDTMLIDFKNKFLSEELVYGIKIYINRVQDSTMISARKMMNHYPTVNEVYTMIDGIRKHILENGGNESDAPMLNVFEKDNNMFWVMVAVPTQKTVTANETYLLKRMLPNGFILVSEVQGGLFTIHKSEAAMKQYVTDHQKSTPAIPFQKLLTDRRAEPDTAKWKTRLYYPVMY